MSTTWTTASSSTVMQDLPLDGSFVAFDLETTGLSSRTERITEIGAVIFRDGQPVRAVPDLCEPRTAASSQKIVDLTGITDAMLRDAPEIEQVLPEFLAVLR